jgi:D-3-phosphoglycerate dehydrogenase
MSWRVLVTCPPMLHTLDHCRDRFAAEGWQVTAPAVTQQLTEAELCEIIADHDGVIAGDDPFTARVLETGRRGRLKALSKWGIGVDAIDLDAARRLGILTSNTPNAFGDEVADVVLGYTVLMARQLHRIDAAIRRGEWLKIRGQSLRGKVAGVIGVGSIGKATATRLRAMGMSLLGFDVATLPSELVTESGLQQVDLATLLGQSDLVVLTCALTAENRYLINEKTLSQIKHGAMIINVARGPLIQETALLAALADGRVSAAALDVFENEPLRADHPLTRFPQVILGSHNSSNTQEAVLRVNQLAIDHLVRDLKQATQPS